MPSVLVIVNAKHQSKISMPSSSEFPNLSIELAISNSQLEIPKLVSKNFDLVVCCGGDGTIHHTINALKNYSQKSTLAILPIGSGNDFVRNFKAHSNIQSILNSYLNNHSKKIDLIKFESASESRFSMNILEVGLGGKVIQYVEKLKSILGPSLAYSASIILGFLTYKPSRLVLYIDDKRIEEDSLLIAFGNGKYFGNKIGICPQAQIDDGILNLTLVKNVSVITYLNLLPKLKKAKEINHPQLEYIEASKVQIENPNGIPIEADGEYLGNQSFSVSVVKDAIKLVINE